MFMHVVIGDYEWSIVQESLLQKKITIKRKGKRTKIVWKDASVIMTEEEAIHALQLPASEYRIISPAGVIVKKDKDKVKRIRCICGELTIRTGQERLCQKCNRIYIWDRETRSWTNMLNPSFVRRSSVEIEKDNFWSHTEKKLNDFKMVTSGSKVVDNHRSRDWNNMPKEVDLKKICKMICLDGKVRNVEIEHIDKLTVRINMIFLKEEPFPEIGEEIALIQEGQGLHVGYEVIKIKDYSGSAPPKKMNIYRLRKLEDHIPRVIRKNHIQEHTPKGVSRAKGVREVF